MFTFLKLWGIWHIDDTRSLLLHSLRAFGSNDHSQFQVIAELYFRFKMLKKKRFFNHCGSLFPWFCTYWKFALRPPGKEFGWIITKLVSLSSSTSGLCYTGASLVVDHILSHMLHFQSCAVLFPLAAAWAHHIEEQVQGSLVLGWFLCSPATLRSC